ncbi:hypothetical protein [Homoserinibacter sp. GY 40078]|uniref:hypothetical protein n=1 Tax=Homoserinibacter sp. GY 40078 TaxID=2603275 RepID=UPI0011CBD570|nr:hypothetical protein [Homoserinibacter sp. GY 40078]TXK19120.1 hypothetical protein FVQ89_04140 [Homoserinibacter sp. GY 40078]
MSLTPEGDLPVRLNLHRIKVACMALREVGFENPLIELDLAISGEQVVIRFRDTVIDARTGQQRFLETEQELKRNNLLQDPELVAHLNEIRARFRATQATSLFEFGITHAVKVGP